VPGLKVATPATVQDARWMLATALADPDPVIIFEHASLYNMAGELPAQGEPVDLAHAQVRRPGSDLSLITYGGSLPKAMAAAEELNGYGISAQVLDLRMLRPLDTEAITTSVAATHRAVIVDEGWRSAGISAEIAARIAEHAIWELDAPIARVCSEEVPIPYARHLEQAATPQVTNIVAAARTVTGR
jgi:pyruvate dehydrogenase E1 component beta subunit